MMAMITLFTFLFAGIYLSPFANMVVVSLREHGTLSQAPGSSMLPMVPVTFTYEGRW